MKKLSVTTVGGGTGTFAVISALKDLGVEICSIVAVSDSGGSTGRIRDEFGFQPVGDLRQSLAALADPAEQEWVQKLLLYRFEKGNSFKGHNLGNLIMTALQDMTASTTQALEIAARLFDLHGRVIPVTEGNVQLKITYQDGSFVVGEHILDEKPNGSIKKISQVSLIPKCKLNPTAQEVLNSSDLIIIGPGDYFASLMAALAVPGINQAMKSSRAKIMYVVNLMTRITQTKDMSALDHLRGIEKVIDRKVDFVLVNSGKISVNILKLYALENEFPVIDDLDSKLHSVIKADVLGTTIVKKSRTDVSHRSLLRHDANKIKKVIASVLKKL